MRMPTVANVTLLVGSLGAVIAILSPSTAPAAVLNLGSEQIVQAGGGDLSVPGYSVPCFTDFNNDGLKDLLVGNTNGEILLYANHGSDSMPSFSTPDSVAADGVDIDLPGVPRSRPFISDWTGDGLPDLIIGAGDGRIHLFQSVPFDEADFDEDGDVDGEDFAAWQIGFSKTGGASHGDGDADADADVDGSDFLIWQRQLNMVTGSLNTGSLNSAAIPEPGSFLLLITGFVAAFRRRQRLVALVTNVRSRQQLSSHRLSA